MSKPTPEGEDALARRAQQGDVAATAALWRGLEGRVRTRAHHVCRDYGQEHRSDDAFEEARAVFLFDVLKNWDPTRSRANEKYSGFWRFAQVRLQSRLIDWLRRESRMRLLEDEEMHTAEADLSPSEAFATEASQIDDQKQVEQVLRCALDVVTHPAERDRWFVLHLFRVHGVKLREVSDALALAAAGVSSAAVLDVGEAWEAVTASWAALAPGIELPLPLDWPGCIALFCLRAEGDEAPPTPPVSMLVQDPATRSHTLTQWYNRLKRWHLRTNERIVQSVLKK